MSRKITEREEHNIMRMLQKKIPSQPMSFPLYDGIPLYNGVKPKKTRFNHVMHKYPHFLHLFYKPTNKGVWTPYLKSRGRYAYQFSPNPDTKKWNMHLMRQINQSSKQSPSKRANVKRMYFLGNENESDPILHAIIPTGRKRMRASLNSPSSSNTSPSNWKRHGGRAAGAA